MAFPIHPSVTRVRPPNTVTQYHSAFCPNITPMDTAPRKETPAKNAPSLFPKPLFLR